MHNNGMRPIHPGEILKEEYLEPLGIPPAALGTTAQFWLNLQAAYDLRKAEIERVK